MVAGQREEKGYDESDLSMVCKVKFSRQRSHCVNN